MKKTVSAPAVLAELPRQKADTMLAASQAAIRLFIEHDSTEFTVREIADHVGISERSFYRYFPTKEDVIKPAVIEAMRRSSAAMAKRPATETIQESIVAAFTESWFVVPIERAWKMFRILNATDSFRAVWLQTTRSAERQWAALIAQRLGIDAESRQATIAGAAVAAAARLSLESSNNQKDHENSGRILADYLSLLGPQLFTRATSK
jgi:AcrR family transcriptional regulator